MTNHSISTEVATAAVKLPKKKWVNFFCIDATDFLSVVTHYCVGWRKDFIQILDALAKQYLLEAETLLSELKVGVIKNKNKLKKRVFFNSS